MRSSHPVTQRLGLLLFAAVSATAGCGAGADDSVDRVDGVVLSVVPDWSDEPADVVFAAVPDLLVTNDGRVLYAAPVEYAIQGTLVTDVWVQAINRAGLDVVREAVEAGEPLRNIDDLTALVEPELGDVDRYMPETFRFAAVELGPVAGFDDPDMPLVEWPTTASIALADATECTRLPELEVGEVFVTAAENSAFVDDGMIYGVLAAPDWPGAPCTLPD